MYEQDEHGKRAMNGTPNSWSQRLLRRTAVIGEDGSEHLCPIARTHSEIVKFGTHDTEYEKVLQRLKGLARRARRRGTGSTAKNGKDEAQEMAATLPRSAQRPEPQLGGASTGECEQSRAASPNGC